VGEALALGGERGELGKPRVAELLADLLSALLPSAGYGFYNGI